MIEMHARSDTVLARPEVDRLLFEDFYGAEFQRVFNAAYAVCRDPDSAIEATQEAFARAFQRWRRLGRQEWAGAWVTTTALNVLRRQNRRQPRSSITTRSSEPNPGDRVEVLDALRLLPWRQQQAAVLFYIADLPVSGVASAMGLSEGTVKAHLSRARAHLRRSLEERHER